MRIDQQRRFHHMLEGLKSREAFPREHWLDLVAEGIRAACSSKSVFYKEIAKLKQEVGTAELTENMEKRCIALLTAAQEMLKILPPEHPDAAVAREVRAAFNDFFFRSYPFWRWCSC